MTPINQILNCNLDYINYWMKKKIQHINYGVTKTELNHQGVMMDLMKKLLEETVMTNDLLRGLLGQHRHPNGLDPLNRKASTGVSFFQRQILGNIRPNTEQKGERQKLIEVQEPGQKSPHKQQSDMESKYHSSVNQSHADHEIESHLTKMFELFQNEFKNNSEANRQLISKILQEKGSKKIKSNEEASLKQIMDEIFHKQSSKKKYSNYGIISEIMPFSDKRQVKVKFTISDLIGNKKISQMEVRHIKYIVTQWVGMVFRAAASICWNMLVNNSLNFEEVKILFTQNVIYNFIELMIELENSLDQSKRLEITSHINEVSRDVLQFLCKQYPQTKIQAPNMALRKAIPMVQNQGEIKYDTISMVLKEKHNISNELQQISFEFRQDKDYSSSIMKTINYMIQKTDQQFDSFQKIMSGIFENIFLPKDKRSLTKTIDVHQASADGTLAQYRAKVKTYSSYAIGRKIPKNTPKYTDLQIQYGVFYVKAPSILRIITKWMQQLYESVGDAQNKQKSSNQQLKNHSGHVINMSSRIKTLLFQKVGQRLPKIKSKIDRIKQQCYNMEFQLTSKKFIDDETHGHLGDDQLCVGKFCSSLKNAISSYVCGQLCKLIYYLALVPKQTDENQLDIQDQDFLEQARKHLDSVNLTSLRIFDLLRCKCHSNEEEIIWIIQALKQLQRTDKKFQIVRVKDRLNQGTRDILINAQYDGGLVWEIQLAVTSNVDKKQDLLDKYNHFLYELKRAKLGPISESVSIWSSLEQRSIYFEQLYQKKKEKNQKMELKHLSKQCKVGDLKQFTEFKRPIICFCCKQYYSIPKTSLLNIRCETCRITYCGQCFHASLNQQQKKLFIFQNFDQKKLLTRGAFAQLVQYTDFKKPFPTQGFFIKKYFLNRELSYFTLVQVGQNKDDKKQKQISLSQTVFRDQQRILCRALHKNQIFANKDINDQYTLSRNFKQLNNFWFYYFPKIKSKNITFSELQEQLKSEERHNEKYLNVLEEPNFMAECSILKKYYEKMRLINVLKQAASCDENYVIRVLRFNHFTILAGFQSKDQKKLKEYLVKKSNKKIIRGYAKKKKTIVHLEEIDISTQFDELIQNNNTDFNSYLTKIEKIYLADNYITNLNFMSKMVNLQLLYITKNQLKSLKGVEKLIKLTYIKFDDNYINSLQQLAELTNLTYISGNQNQITNLKGLQKLYKLESISLCTNKITDISEIGNLSSLRRVFFKDNPLSTIDILSKLPLTHIFIGQTSINATVISSFNCANNLIQISLKGINLPSIPKIFDKMLKLVQLKLSDNKIKKIQNIEKLILLKSIDLRNNEIQVMENLDHLNILEQLKLNNNKIKVVTCVKSYIDSLKVLNLQNNPLEDLSHYLMYEENSGLDMRLKYTENIISSSALAQIKAHSFEHNNKSDIDD